jgi:ribosomal protein L29
MKYKELKSMPKDEIEGKLKELQMDLIKANAQIATGTIPKNPGQVKQTKKTIAKIKQLLKEDKAKTEGKKE